MTRTDFEKLRVYQLAEELSDPAWEAAQKWDGLARETIGKQFIDSLGKPK